MQAETRVGRLPDFIIGGAPRSGTTLLYHLLDRHSRISMAKPVRPEPKFFLEDGAYSRGLDYYSQRWFSDFVGDQILGEKSTNYLESAIAAERILSCLPKVKLIFLLREPAMRAWSNYLWSRMNGYENESFERALELESEREESCPEELRFSRPHAYVSRGFYADLLLPYLRRFSRSQILCLRFEDLIDPNAHVLSRVQQFLGVARDDDATTFDVVNPSSGPAPPTKVLESLRGTFEEPNRKLVDLLGDSFTIWSNP